MFRLHRRWNLLLASALPCAAAACVDVSPEDTQELRETEQTVVYGEDSRLDWYAHPDDGLRELTSNAIVAMMDSRDFDDRDPFDIIIDGPTLANAQSLCEGERFADHPAVAGCSGTLIDDDLVLTAGHCVSERDCSGTYWVFNFYYESEGQLAQVTEDDVYRCANVLVDSGGGGGGWGGGGGGGGSDYAIVQLDRSVVGHEPAEFNFDQWPVEDGERVKMVGFGSGIPAKLDSDGVVLSNNFGNNQDDFRATVDAFGGNSGSGVFDEDNRVVGILVAGEQDYEFRGGCQRVAELPEEGGPQGGEQITYAILAVNELCEDGFPSERLCNIEVVCGDGICNGGETFDTCPEDCDEPAPGPEVPDGWFCEPEYYDAGDDCDCECGAYDPDCDNPRLRVVNCERGEICNLIGECQDPDEPQPEPEPEPEPGPVAPDGWICDAAFYGAGDGCDCRCGIYDPDCDDPDATVFNCLPGQLCGADGECTDEEPQPTPEPVDPDAGTPEADAGADDPDATPTGTTDTGGGRVFINGANSGGCAAAGGAPPAATLALLLGLLGLRRRRL